MGRQSLSILRVSRDQEMKIKYIYSGIKSFLKHEGVKSLISRGYRYLLRRFLVFEDYYVIVSEYEDIDKEVEADFFRR